MLFNSYIFLFLFLPITLITFYWIGSVGKHRIAIAWLVAASLFFYGWWNPAYLGLILGSMLFNYSVGVALSSMPRKVILAFGVTANLGMLSYYKYANFFVENINVIAESAITLETIILPLAISFFTFQQVAYLVDAYRGKTHEYRFLHYALFVTFFPQLIAGPIVHHKEMLPQFARNSIYRINLNHIAVGISIFTFGLFKKVILADGISVYATPVFDAAEAGIILTFFEAWTGAIAYTLQLYFDFSGYSDMAIGLARMFGVRLPLNFNSPYKATSIIDFWRRWHITLSRFLRDYLYIPLGGNKKGEVRRMIYLMITMLLGGLWHGAGWTFVIWGGLHGSYLIINHGWRTLKAKITKQNSGYIGNLSSWLLTFIAVIIAWVPFRAETTQGAVNILESMVLLNGLSLPEALLGQIGPVENWLITKGVVFDGVLTNGVLLNTSSARNSIIGLLFIATVLPNTQQIMRRYRPALSTYNGKTQCLRFHWLSWRPTWQWGLLIGCALLYTTLNMGQKVSEFLYYQF